MQNDCDTCNTPISSTCIRWQGDKLYFTKDLKKKYDFEEIVVKITTDLKEVKDIIETPIDQKGIDFACDVKTLPNYVQWLIDRYAENQNKTTSTNEGCCSDITISGLDSCNGGAVSVEEAIAILMNEINLLKQKVNQNTSNIYIPNV